MRRVALSWSSGKDAAWTLHTLRQQGVEPACLLTSLNTEAGRVAMHGVRREVLRAQAEAVGVPLREVDLPWPCSNADYEARMGAAFEDLRAEGITHVAFGDLFLADVRAYRERQLAGTGLAPLFPLWSQDTRALADEMLHAGTTATVVCADPAQVNPDIVGRAWDPALLAALPASADPCGENGEFHTLCADGPAFQAPLAFEVGETVVRGGFHFADVRLE